jgi:hypothetical protein
MDHLLRVVFGVTSGVQSWPIHGVHVTSEVEADAEESYSMWMHQRTSTTVAR